LFIRRNQRDGYTFSQSEKSAGNYFPLVTGILLKVRRKKRKRVIINKKIKDETKDLQLTVVTDRAQGGGSIRDGQIEIMVS
jgi:hypothetical protein